MAKKSKSEISRERAERWARFGVLGQVKYGIRALTRVIEDPLVPEDLRSEAAKIRTATQQLMLKYRKHLNV